MYAYVSFKDGKREVIQTENIRHFDPINFDKNKLYNILWKDGHYYDGAIAFVRETEQEIKDEIMAKRTNVPPIDNCLTASDISENETVGKQPVSKGHTDLVSRKIESLKLKQIERRKKRDADKINETKQSRIRTKPSETQVDICLTTNSQISDDEANEKEQPVSKEYTGIIKSKNQTKEGLEKRKTRKSAEERHAAEEEDKQNESATFLTETGSDYLTNYQHLKRKIVELEQKLKQKAIEIEALKTQAEQERYLITDCMRANVDLQKKVISQFNEMKDIVRHLRQNNPETADPNGAYVAVGSQRMDGLMESIHIGRDLWIPAGQFDTILCQTKPTVFVRELAKIIFGEKILLQSTVTGKISNRSKCTNTTKKLDGRKLAAIRDSLEFLLSTKSFNNMDMVTKHTHPR